jgi:glucarate dehydratase
MPRVTSVTVTPIAFRDPPLLNAVGVHEPWALRSIIEMATDDGITGISESYGDAQSLKLFEQCRDSLIGLDVFDCNGLKRAVARAIAPPTEKTGMELAPGTTAATSVARASAAFEVAFLDAAGKSIGRPVYDLLGGAVRKSIPFSAYLFYKFGRHRFLDDGWVDPWGEALTPEQIVEQARRMVEGYGFGSIKLKGGVFEPEAEIEAIRALRAAFPKTPLRIDPNAAWTVETTKKLLPRLEPLLEYLEDPVPTIPGMAAVQRSASIPLATNMCVIRFDDLPAAVAQGAVKVVLSDHHYWGGLRATLELAAMCRVWNLGLSMHSNSHLGISLMAMCHAAAAAENLTYACDTHYPWQEEEVLIGGRIAFREGAVELSDRPGLGVELDRDALATLADNYRKCGIRVRDDTAEMRRYDPQWTGKTPRF